MNKLKILNKIEVIEDGFMEIFKYIFVYGMSIGFLLIGITIWMIPDSPETPKWVVVILGFSFLLLGLHILIMAIKYSLEQSMEKENEIN